MKKTLLLCAFALWSGILFSQDTLTGWNFPVNTGQDSLNANMGTSQNQGYDLRLQMILSPTADSTINSIYFINGASTFAAATANWDNGANSKFWSVKFKAPNYSNFKLWSKQRSDATNPGPKDFKLQWRLSSTTYEDVPSGAITAGNDWTTGVVSALPIPITSPGTSSIYIRWIMTTNNDINGGTVGPDGISSIDDILVTASTGLGQEDVIYTNRLTIGPNPSNGNFTVTASEPLEMLTILDANGRKIQTILHPANVVSIKLQEKGMYIIKGKFRDNNALFTTKVVVE